METDKNYDLLIDKILLYIAIIRSANSVGKCSILGLVFLQNISLNRTANSGNA